MSPSPPHPGGRDPRVEKPPPCTVVTVQKVWEVSGVLPTTNMRPEITQKIHLALWPAAAFLFNGINCGIETPRRRRKRDSAAIFGCHGIAPPAEVTAKLSDPEHAPPRHLSHVCSLLRVRRREAEEIVLTKHAQLKSLTERGRKERLTFRVPIQGGQMSKPELFMGNASFTFHKVNLARRQKDLQEGTRTEGEETWSHIVQVLASTSH